ncbi:hypothetical protein [uncultured Treponema sp.]|nr:hypothetical protein [uncultured Treponema sp.]
MILETERLFLREMTLEDVDTKSVYKDGYGKSGGRRSALYEGFVVLREGS